MKKITLLLISILITSNLLSQEYTIENAKKTTAEFLKALKILDLPEGKELVSGLVFESNNSFPVISSSEILFEKLFDTDIDGIKGYKGLLEIKSISKANTPLILRYILISYLDKKDSKWKVFAFRETIDIENEILSCKQSLNSDNDSRPMQYRLRNLAYWEILNGELSSATKNFRNAYSEAESNNDTNFKIPTSLVLNSITGSKTE
ncbi:hypothetical protein [Aquimarina algiphila]|uniref:hypothetical protein n=1 Tax=Aquimarina algiphila TaxID=2047982 RepID=UPI00232E7DFC|nr:hypothetical protein [Aquimarina algiphila]